MLELAVVYYLIGLLMFCMGAGLDMFFHIQFNERSLRMGITGLVYIFTWPVIFGWVVFSAIQHVLRKDKECLL